MLFHIKRAFKPCVDSKEYYWTKSEAWENASDVYFYDNIRLPIYHTRKFDAVTLTCFR